MAKVDYRSLAGEILRGVGGEGNIAGASHCATRLRLKLHDESLADKAAIEKLPGVITVMPAGGQYQVVIGNNVSQTYEELARITKLGTPEEQGEEPKGNLMSRFIDLITTILHPVLWTLAAAGLLKAFVALATTFDWLSTDGSTYVILNALSDALFYFLPIMLAVGASKKFKTNTITSMTIAAALVYPAIVDLASATDVTFLGIPVVMANYTSSLIPIIVAVWLQGYAERFLNKVLPGAIRNFTTPLLVLLVMVPLVLITIGPVTMGLSNAVSSGIQYLFEVAPWVAGAILGAGWQIFVIFGLHWALVPVILNDVAVTGQSLIMGPLLAAVLAQSAAMLGVFIRTRSKATREIAGPAMVSGALAGVTEPGVYGVNLPKRKPFVFGCIGGAVGGIIVAMGGGGVTAFVFPSIIGIPAYLNVGNFTLTMIGTGVAVVIALTLTLVLGFPDDKDAVDDDTTVADTSAAPGSDAVAPVGPGGVQILAPVSGTAIALSDVNDKVFSSGAMGAGIGITPSSSEIVAPVSGKLLVVMPHAYGIKSDSGVEILVHIGIDTVNLKGEGFSPQVTKGQPVNAGDVLTTVDWDVVAKAGYDPTTILIVTNTDALQEVLPTPGGPLTTTDPALTVTV